jgi:hypothetical protein
MTERLRLVIDYDCEHMEESVEFTNRVLLFGRETVRMIRVTIEVRDTDE